MQPLTAKDLWPLPVYEGVREQFRKEVIAAKRDRRRLSIERHGFIAAA